MDSGNSTCLTARITMALSVTAMPREKGALFSKEGLSMKAKSDTTLQKEKASSSTTCKNIGTWGAGLMICRMAKARKSGETELLTKGISSMDKNTEKVNIDFQTVVFIKASLSMINLMARVF